MRILIAQPETLIYESFHKYYGLFLEQNTPRNRIPTETEIKIKAKAPSEINFKYRTNHG